MKIEDYGMIGDLQTAALVGSNGSVDWLCLPRFDSASCFSALLGNEHHGRWLLAPAGEVLSVSRRYRPGTLVLETDFETADGKVRLVDFMPRRGDGPPQLMRVVQGLQGRVPMRMELRLRPDYGTISPTVEMAPGGMTAAAGPDAFRLSTPLALDAVDGTVAADFPALEGATERFVLSWYPSYEPAPSVEDAESALARTEAAWREWSDRCTYDGEYRDEVLRSLIVLKAMTHEVTGALVAAPTTSLPEDIGGVRNWDYRFSWLRDSALTLTALFSGGYTEEAEAYAAYVGRVLTGDPSELQIMYGVGGERRLTEFEVDELPGYEGSAPVRVGNLASEQFQMDVFGELAFAVHMAVGLGLLPQDWPQWVNAVSYVSGVWRKPDHGMWEARAEPRHYTSSKVAAWVVFDRSIDMAEKLGLEAPLEGWKQIREEIREQVCERAYDPDRNTFTQYYGSQELDASALTVGLSGLLPPDDERVIGTIEAIERGLTKDGLVSRYSTEHTDDGLPGGEGQFLACSYWLAGSYALTGRLPEARALFERLLGLANDLGLLAEEYDVDRKRQVGNFPQAFSHLALINCARAITLGERHPGVGPLSQSGLFPAP